MTGMGRREYLRAIHGRYQRSKPAAKGAILDEFCSVCVEALSENDCMP